MNREALTMELRELRLQEIAIQWQLAFMRDRIKEVKQLIEITECKGKRKKVSTVGNSQGRRGLGCGAREGRGNRKSPNGPTRF